MTNNPSEFILKLSKIEVTRELVDLMFDSLTEISEVKIDGCDYPANEFYVIISTERELYEIDEKNISYWSYGVVSKIKNVFAIVRYIDNYIKTK